jgi:hypothetical protein
MRGRLTTRGARTAPGPDHARGTAAETEAARTRLVPAPARGRMTTEAGKYASRCNAVSLSCR